MTSNMLLLVTIAIAGINFAAASLSSAEIKACVREHNRLRELHKNTPDLQWDNDLAAAAQKYAEELVRINKRSSKVLIDHDPADKKNGENIKWQDNNKKGTCEIASISWYNEIKDYDYSTARSKNGRAVGHFTQLVWRNTKRFGVGIATMKSREYAQYGNIETFVVAKYSPKGNFHYVGRRFKDYSDNVQPLKNNGGGAVTAKPQTTVKPTTTKSTASCINAIGDADCDSLMKSYSCTGKYQSYFKKNCAKKCGNCGCKDDDGSDKCNRLIKNWGLKCNGRYEDYFKQRCAKYCGHC